MEYEARILVVDDELPVCKSICSVFTNEKCTVDMALSGEEAIEKEKECRYDIIITDLMMPGMSGMEFLKAMIAKCPDAKVIMITGYPSIKTAVQSTKLGAFDYLPKPFTPDELRTLVSRALKQKQLANKTVAGKEPDISVPEGLYYIPENSWVKEESDGNVRIGIHHNFLKTIGEIASIEMPELNKMRYQGETYLRITDINGRVHRLWTPVTGRIVAINEEIKKDRSKLKDDPYNDGWLIKIASAHLQDDLKDLVPLK